jgi:signal transduction histidine kinase
VAGIPAPIHAKLLVAFLAIAALFIALGVVGLQVLGAANDRSVDLGSLERKMAAERQLQTEIQRQQYAGASAFSAVDDAALATIRRQISQSDYNFERLRFVAPNEGATLDKVQEDYGLFIQTLLSVVDLVRNGKRDDAAGLQHTTATPLADDLERLTNELVNKAETEIVTTVDQNHEDYLASRGAVVWFAAGSVALALVLGYAIAFSVIRPVQQMELHLKRVAGGDFSGYVQVPNRDELGVLAANLNRMNDELGQLYRDLETASRHKSEFLANMSHELRTPLNAVIGFSEVLAEHLPGDLNEKQDEYVNDILTSGQHLLSLINDILDISKVEAGRMELESAPFDLVEALESGLSMVRERAVRGGVTLSLDERPAVTTLEADERKIKQVIYNLLSNAVKFTPPGGRVDVSARNVDGEVWISVRDSGIGIAPEDHERIFQEFMQASGRAREQEGTGLGLALARKFIELHGGRIWLESEPGKGSTFTVALPQHRPAPPPPATIVGPSKAEPWAPAAELDSEPDTPELSPRAEVVRHES